MNQQKEGRSKNRLTDQTYNPSIKQTQITEIIKQYSGSNKSKECMSLPTVAKEYPNVLQGPR